MAPTLINPHDKSWQDRLWVLSTRNGYWIYDVYLVWASCLQDALDKLAKHLIEHDDHAVLSDEEQYENFLEAQQDHGCNDQNCDSCWEASVTDYTSAGDGYIHPESWGYHGDFAPKGTTWGSPQANQRCCACDTQLHSVFNPETLGQLSYTCNGCGGMYDAVKKPNPDKKNLKELLDVLCDN